ncbi:MAG: hypothetical protein ACWGNV_05525 [Bacteroidales bacterium]
MWKSVSTLILSVVILAAGYYGATKLRYWERSIWVFKSATPPQRFERRDRSFPREVPLRDGTEQPRPSRDRAERPVPPENRSDAENSRSGQRAAQNSTQFRQNQERDSEVPPSIRRGNFDNDRRGHHGPGRGKKISLGTVGWFLAVFASFTVITLYLDRITQRFRRKNSLMGPN